jgi:hypothetical protein
LFHCYSNPCNGHVASPGPSCARRKLGRYNGPRSCCGALASNSMRPCLMGWRKNGRRRKRRGLGPAPQAGSKACRCRRGIETNVARLRRTNRANRSAIDLRRLDAREKARVVTTISCHASAFALLGIKHSDLPTAGRRSPIPASLDPPPVLCGYKMTVTRGGRWHTKMLSNLP